MLQRSGFETPAGVSNDSWFRGVGLLEAGRGQIVRGREGLDCWRQGGVRLLGEGRGQIVGGKLIQER